MGEMGCCTCSSQGQIVVSSLPFPKWQILDSSKLKDDNFKFADDNFKVDENSIQISKRVENTVEKGETARFLQFLLFPWYFQKTSTADTYKPGLV